MTESFHLNFLNETKTCLYLIFQRLLHHFKNNKTIFPLFAFHRGTFVFRKSIVHKKILPYITILIDQSIKEESKSFASAVQVIDKAHSFLSKQLTSSMVTNILEERQKDIALFDDGHYFELIGTIPNVIDDVQCICAKTYTDNGLCFVMIYFEAVFYCIISDTNEDEPLLDIVFPDVSQEGDGITLGIYDGNENGASTIQWRKLSLWQSIRSPVSEKSFNSSTTISHTLSLPSDMYMQTYCILKPNKPNRSDRDVLFRFGSWCYNGNVDLIETLRVEDIPHVIPALRIQQHKLAYLCDVSGIPKENIFSEPLMHNSRIMKVLENEIVSVESTIDSILEKNESSFIENPTNLFFEFSSITDNPILSNNYIDLIATKAYRPNGLIVITIYFDGKFYVCVSDGDGDQPLLDSEFPSIIQGKGCQLKAYDNGVDSFPELRKLIIWQNAESVKNDDCQGISMKREGEHKNEYENESKNEDLRREISSECNVLFPDECCDDESIKDYSQSEIKDTYSVKQFDHSFNEMEFKHTNNAAEKKSDEPEGENEFKDAKSISFNLADNVSSRKRQNMGAFHHLAPLRRPSALAEQVKKIHIRDSENKQAPYDANGRPLS